MCRSMYVPCVLDAPLCTAEGQCHWVDCLLLSFSTSALEREESEDRENMTFQSHLLERISWGRNQGRVLHHRYSSSSLRHLTIQRRPLLTWLVHLTRPVVAPLTLVKWKSMPSLPNSKRKWAFYQCALNWYWSRCHAIKGICLMTLVNTPVVFLHLGLSSSYIKEAAAAQMYTVAASKSSRLICYSIRGIYNS